LSRREPMLQQERELQKKKGVRGETGFPRVVNEGASGSLVLWAFGPVLPCRGRPRPETLRVIALPGKKRSPATR
jgi:hypothetical protein